MRAWRFPQRPMTATLKLLIFKNTGPVLPQLTHAPQRSKPPENTVPPGARLLSDSSSLCQLRLCRPRPSPPLWRLPDPQLAPVGTRRPHPLRPWTRAPARLLCALVRSSSNPGMGPDPAPGLQARPDQDTQHPTHRPVLTAMPPLPVQDSSPQPAALCPAGAWVLGAAGRSGPELQPWSRGTS